MPDYTPSTTYGGSSDQRSLPSYINYDETPASQIQPPGTAAQQKGTTARQNGTTQTPGSHDLGVNANQLATLFAQLQNSGLPTQPFLPRNTSANGFPPLPAPPPLPPNLATPILSKTSTTLRTSNAPPPAPRQSKLAIPVLNQPIMYDEDLDKSKTKGSNEAGFCGQENKNKLVNASIDRELRPTRGTNSRNLKHAEYHTALKTDSHVLHCPLNAHILDMSQPVTFNSELHPPISIQPASANEVAGLHPLKDLHKNVFQSALISQDKDLDRMRQSAKRFVSFLTANKFSYGDLIREGLNPALLKEVFDELRIPTFDGILHSRHDKLAGLEAETGLRDAKAGSAVPLEHRSSPPRIHAHAVAKTKPSVSNIVSSTSVVINSRQAYLEKLKAAAGPKSSEPPRIEQNSQDNATQPAPDQSSNPSKFSADMPTQAVANSSSALTSLVEAKRRAQTELARKRMEALNAKRMAAAAQRASQATPVVQQRVISHPAQHELGPCAISVSKTRGNSGQSSPRSSIEARIFSDQELQELENTTVAEQIIVAEAKPSFASHFPVQSDIPSFVGLIPGLFVEEEGELIHLLTDNDPQSEPVAPLTPSKRSISLGVEDTAEQSRPNIKRPFVSSQPNHYDERCIIEVSDDETGSAMDMDDVKYQSPANGPPSCVESQMQLTDPVPSRSTYPSTSIPKSPLPGSAAATPAVYTPGSSYSSDELRRKEAEIALMKQRIREREAKQKRDASANGSVTNTPLPSRAMSEQIASSSSRVGTEDPVRQTPAGTFGEQESAEPSMEISYTVADAPTSFKVSSIDSIASQYPEDAMVQVEEDEQLPPAQDKAVMADSPLISDTNQVNTENEHRPLIQTTLTSGCITIIPRDTELRHSISSVVKIPGLDISQINPNFHFSPQIDHFHRGKPTYDLQLAPLSMSAAISHQGENHNSPPNALFQETHVFGDDDSMQFSEASESSGDPDDPPTQPISTTNFNEFGKTSRRTLSPCSSIFSTSTPDETAADPVVAATSGQNLHASRVVGDMDHAEVAAIHRVTEGRSDDGEMSESNETNSESGTSLHFGPLSENESEEVYQSAELGQSSKSIVSTPLSLTSEHGGRNLELPLISNSASSSATQKENLDSADSTDNMVTEVNCSTKHNPEVLCTANSLVQVQSSALVDNFNNILFKPYESPLKLFKAYRFHPHYISEVSDGFRSMTYSHRIDANLPLCQYEAAGGLCNDDGCSDQHFRAMALTDDMLLMQLGTSNPGSTPEETQRWNESLKIILTELRRLNTRDSSVVASVIANYRREFLRDPSRVLDL